MPRETITPQDGPRPSGAYSPAVRAGDFIFVSGQGPFDPSTGGPAGDDIGTQVRQTLQNVNAILQAAGAGLDDVVRVDVYLADMGDFDEYDAAYRSVFPSDPPTR